MRSSSPALLRQMATPATPPAGTTALYAKTDNRVYLKDPSGTETRVSLDGDDYAPGFYTGKTTGAVTLTTGVWGRFGNLALVADQNLVNGFTYDGLGFISPVAGCFFVSISVQFAANTSGRRYCGVTWGSAADGTSPLFGWQTGISAGTNPMIPSWSGDVVLTVGARIMAWAFQDSGGNLAANQCQLRVRRVGPAPTS